MTRDGERPLQVARRGDGYAAWGPGFYLWREDAGELLRDASALAGPGAGSGHTPRRPRASSASRRRASIAAR